MEAMIEQIEKIMDKDLSTYQAVDDSDPIHISGKTITAKEIAEHLEEYDKWKLKNCEVNFGSDGWMLYDDNIEIVGSFTNSELYQYYLDNVLGK